jgi:hypothetical protein
VRKKPEVPKLDLRREGFRDFNHAIRELLELDLGPGYYTYESIILILPYYLARISRCEIQDNKLLVDIEPYNETITLENLKCKYNYEKIPDSSVLGGPEGDIRRDEISPLSWRNEVELPIAPSWGDVYLFFNGIEELIDQCRVVSEKTEIPPSRGFDVEVKLPEMFEDLKAVLVKAGFNDAEGKIVLAAATNLMEVVVTKKLQDLGADLGDNLNTKIERVIDIIREKEGREIDHQLISFAIKTARDKLDHEGFKLFVGNVDAGFFLQRTIDFLRQLYP